MCSFSCADKVLLCFNCLFTFFSSFRKMLVPLILACSCLIWPRVCYSGNIFVVIKFSHLLN